LLSVIIPALNEADCIGGLIAQLTDQQNLKLEIIVADGGSTDATCQIVRDSGAVLITSGVGRGRQMNAGASVAKGEYLLFLHADSKLTTSDQLSHAVEFMDSEEGRCAGHFTMVFETEDADLADQLRFFELKTSLNRPGTFNGDQGLLIRRQDFQLLGGFSERLPILEDQDFGRRFRLAGSFVTLPGEIATSARRFEHEGLHERIMLNAFIMGMFHLGMFAFFKHASDIYRQHDRSEKIDLLPFFSLVKTHIFMRGFGTGIAHCYRLGRYTTRNLWQLFLWMSLKDGETDRWLGGYDRIARPLTDNPLGYALGTISLIGWFYLARLRVRMNRRRQG
jgi:rSAM/selenodomain-associated transferase 2